jgi:hypothetical protein
MNKQQIDRFLCQWSMDYGHAFKEEELNSLVDAIDLTITHETKQLHSELAVLKVERDDLMFLLRDINSRVLPGEMDSVDGMLQIKRQRDRFEKQLQEDAKEIILSLLGQYCSDDKLGPNGETLYDSMCMSAGECALAFAVEMGWIKKEQVTR